MPDRLFAMGLQSFDAYGRPQHRRTWRYHVPVAICKCHLCSHIRLAFSLETQGFRVPSVPNIGHKCEKWDEVRHNSHIATFHISFHRFPFSVHLQPPRQTLEVASKCKHHFSFSRFSAVWHLKSTTPPRDSWEAYHLLSYAMLFEYGQRCAAGGSATSVATHTYRIKLRPNTSFCTTSLLGFQGLGFDWGFRCLGFRFQF